MIEYKTKYKKQYRNLDSFVKKLVERALTDILNSDSPYELGEFKKHSNTCTYRLNKSNRLMYKVYPDRIVLLAVGDHKAVYGSD